jgi:hypothetical protein
MKTTNISKAVLGAYLLLRTLEHQSSAQPQPVSQPTPAQVNLPVVVASTNARPRCQMSSTQTNFKLFGVTITNYTLPGQSVSNLNSKDVKQEHRPLPPLRLRIISAQ